MGVGFNVAEKLGLDLSMSDRPARDFVRDAHEPVELGYSSENRLFTFSLYVSQFYNLLQERGYTEASAKYTLSMLLKIPVSEVEERVLAVDDFESKIYPMPLRKGKYSKITTFPLFYEQYEYGVFKDIPYRERGGVTLNRIVLANSVIKYLKQLNLKVTRKDTPISLLESVSNSKGLNIPKAWLREVLEAGCQYLIGGKNTAEAFERVFDPTTSEYGTKPYFNRSEYQEMIRLFVLMEDEESRVVFPVINTMSLYEVSAKGTPKELLSNAKKGLKEVRVGDLLYYYETKNKALEEMTTHEMKQILDPIEIVDVGKDGSQDSLQAGTQEQSSASALGEGVSETYSPERHFNVVRPIVSGNPQPQGDEYTRRYQASRTVATLIGKPQTSVKQGLKDSRIKITKVASTPNGQSQAQSQVQSQVQGTSQSQVSALTGLASLAQFQEKLKELVQFKVLAEARIQQLEAELEAEKEKNAELSAVVKAYEEQVNGLNDLMNMLGMTSVTAS